MLGFFSITASNSETSVAFFNSADWSPKIDHGVKNLVLRNSQDTLIKMNPNALANALFVHIPWLTFALAIHFGDIYYGGVGLNSWQWLSFIIGISQAATVNEYKWYGLEKANRGRRHSLLYGPAIDRWGLLWLTTKAGKVVKAKA